MKRFGARFGLFSLGKRVGKIKKNNNNSIRRKSFITNNVNVFFPAVRLSAQYGTYIFMCASVCVCECVRAFGRASRFKARGRLVFFSSLGFFIITVFDTGNLESKRMSREYIAAREKLMVFGARIWCDTATFAYTKAFGVNCFTDKSRRLSRERPSTIFTWRQKKKKKGFGNTGSSPTARRYACYRNCFRSSSTRSSTRIDRPVSKTSFGGRAHRFFRLDHWRSNRFGCPSAPV